MTAKIGNCQVEFRYRCPERWEALDATARPEVRHCATCESEVHYCASLEEIAEHATRGHCVAFDAEEKEERMFMGLVDEPTRVHRPR